MSPNMLDVRGIECTLVSPNTEIVQLHKRTRSLGRYRRRYEGGIEEDLARGEWQGSVTLLGMLFKLSV